MDVEELEDHLRGEVAALRGAGLSEDEAFLVAVKRMGALDAISNEFAREHSERLWKQLVIASTGATRRRPSARTEAIVVFALAVVGGAGGKGAGAVRARRWARRRQPFYMRNFSLFVLPLLTGYFVWKRRLERGAPGVAGPGVRRPRSCSPMSIRSSRQRHGGAHRAAPADRAVAARGIAYAGGRWGETAGRMDFVRFSGELFIYYALIALGGGVLIAFTMGMFKAIGIDAEPVVAELAGAVRRWSGR